MRRLRLGRPVTYAPQGPHVDHRVLATCQAAAATEALAAAAFHKAGLVHLGDEGRGPGVFGDVREPRPTLREGEEVIRVSRQDLGSYWDADAVEPGSEDVIGVHRPDPDAVSRTHRSQTPLVEAGGVGDGDKLPTFLPALS